MVLIPEVLEAIAAIGSKIPVLAAGGIVTGRQMAASVALGADGAWTGSVWLTTEEAETAPHTVLEFPPGSCWLVYTDQVLHAALAGEFALEQTFHFDVARMGEPEHAPIRLLEKLTGRSLA